MIIPSGIFLLYSPCFKFWFEITNYHTELVSGSKASLIKNEDANPIF